MKLSPFGFGAAPLGGVYGSYDDARAIVRTALASGFTYFDTAPYYGNSQAVLGEALYSLRDEYPRSGYLISTKVGRYPSGFDYSSGGIEQSILESLELLRTDYIDVVFCHDVEFVSREEVQEALVVLRKLRDSGVVKYIGISGYPVDLLYRLACWQHEVGTPLDIVLSYCHFTLITTDLEDYVPKFREVGVQTVVNASPMAMGLLSAKGPPEWHKAPPELKTLCKEVADDLAKDGTDISEVALAYSLTLRTADTLLVGCQSKEHVEMAARVLAQSASERYTKLFGSVIAKLGRWRGFSWISCDENEVRGQMSN